MQTKLPLTGLNLYRALAIVLMVIAHTARLQLNLAEISTVPGYAGIFDQLVLGILKIEPAISAMFLFIAGFSQVLSLQANRGPSRGWLLRQWRRCLQLYAIGIAFYLGDEGVQWPDLLVSPGILSVIAIALAIGAACLASPKSLWALAVCVLAGLLTTVGIEQSHANIPGLNAGAGGLLPLITVAWLGAITGIIRLRWPQLGMQVLVGASLLISLFSLSNNAAWVTHPLSSIRLYPGDRVMSVIYSLQDMIGLYNGNVQVRTTAYWNHAAIFVPRALPFLILGLMLFLSVFKVAKHPLTVFFNRLGSQALNVYILHLLLLAPLELLSLKPATGWQTMLLVAAIVAVAPWMLRYFSFVPFRIGMEKSALRTDRT